MTTETDRELLELAAKAYWGAEIDDVCSVRWLEEDQAIGYTHADNQDHNGIDREYLWNPLTDDGDALRLAVKLRLYLRIEEYGAAARLTDLSQWHGCEAHLYGGIESATRRAIVRAAAAIGKEMKP